MRKTTAELQAEHFAKTGRVMNRAAAFHAFYGQAKEASAMKPFFVGFEKAANELNTKDRNALPDNDFVFPKERKFPIHDVAHARNALARAHFASDPEKVRRAVHARYPEIAEEKK